MKALNVLLVFCAILSLSLIAHGQNLDSTWKKMSNKEVEQWSKKNAKQSFSDLTLNYTIKSFPNESSKNPLDIINARFVCKGDSSWSEVNGVESFYSPNLVVCVDHANKYLLLSEPAPLDERSFKKWNKLLENSVTTYFKKEGDLLSFRFEYPKGNEYQWTELTMTKDLVPTKLVLLMTAKYPLDQNKPNENLTQPRIEFVFDVVELSKNEIEQFVSFREYAIVGDAVILNESISDYQLVDTRARISKK